MWYSARARAKHMYLGVVRERGLPVLTANPAGLVAPKRNARIELIPGVYPDGPRLHQQRPHVRYRASIILDPKQFCYCLTV